MIKRACSQNLPPFRGGSTHRNGTLSMGTPSFRVGRGWIVSLFLILLFLLTSPLPSFSMNGSGGKEKDDSKTATQDQKPMKFGAGVAVPAPGPSTDGYVVEFLLGGDMVLNNPSYGTLAGVVNNGNGTYTEIPGGPNVPYNFGTGPTWALRAGKMVYQDLLVYLTLEQTFFAHNTHSIIGLGGNYYLPSPGKTTLRPYLNALFGASDNTFTGTNAQTGYSWMVGAGALLPLSSSWGVFVEADLAYESAPTGITTTIGAPPGIISSVSDVWDVPVMIGIRYAF